MTLQDATKSDSDVEIISAVIVTKPAKHIRVKAEPGNPLPAPPVNTKDQEENSNDCDVGLMETIEIYLLQPYPPIAIEPSNQCHIGHLLHGLVALCRKHAPAPWVNHVCVIDTTNKSLELSKVQKKATLHLGIVASKSHWSLAAIDLAGGKSCVYDGQSNPVILERAKKWVDSYTNNISFESAQVPKQMDDVSCGHRVLLAADHVLRSMLLEHHGLPVRLPEDFASASMMESLKTLVIVPEVSKVKHDPSLRERSPRRATPNSHARIKEEPQSKRARISQSSEVQPNAEGSVPTTPRHVPNNDQFDAESPKGKVPKIAKAKTRAKKKARVDPERVETIRNQLDAQGLQHNDIFQKRHAMMKIPPVKGHWKDFLTSLALDAAPSCEACRELADEYFHQKENVPGQLVAQQDADPTAVPVPVMDAEDLKGHPGRKRGRPRKGTSAKDFLVQWIPLNRNGIYAEQEDSAKDFKYYCNACQKEVKFFRDALTYVHLHERECTAHRRGLECLGLSLRGEETSQRAPCSGMPVLDDKSPLGLLTKSLSTWFNAGQPSGGGEGQRKCALESVSWRLEGDVIIVRHKECTAPVVASGSGCHECSGKYSDNQGSGFLGLQD